MKEVAGELSSEISSEEEPGVVFTRFGGAPLDSTLTLTDSRFLEI